jgi:nucleotide-binding universal stress UspA family protein
MRILLAYDGSTFAEEAVTLLIESEKRDEAEVRVLDVVGPALAAAPPQMAPGYAPELEETKKRAKQFVDGAVTRLRLAGYRAEGAVMQGEVRKTILEMANEWKVDLILLGSHGYGHVKRFLLGSVAEYVARHAECSVEIARAKRRNAYASRRL